MAASSSDKRESIDLGLSALLSSLGVASPSEGHAQAEPLPAAAPTADGSSSFQELLAGKRWQEMIAAAESSLAASGSPTNSLWWIRGHLGALSMPVSFLISPFEQVVRGLSVTHASADERRLLEETSSLMLERLQQVGERAHVEAFEALLREHGIGEISGSLGKHRHTWTLSAQSSEAPMAPQGAPQPERAPSPRRALRYRGVLLLLFLLVCVFALIAAFRPALLSLPKVFSPESYLRDPDAPEQEAPALSPRDPVGDLSALYYSIEAATPQMPSATIETAPVSSSEPRTPQPTPAATPRPKERVNTSGPIEGEEYRRGAARSASGSMSGMEPPPQPYLPGRKAPPTPFDRHIEVHEYKVIAPTNVVASPSYVAMVLGRLEPGDTVLVESRVGAWIRLRSRRGNPGYVLAQDVVRADSTDAAERR